MNPRNKNVSISINTPQKETAYNRTSSYSQAPTLFRSAHHQLQPRIQFPQFMMTPTTIPNNFHPSQRHINMSRLRRPQFFTTFTPNGRSIHSPQHHIPKGYLRLTKLFLPKMRQLKQLRFVGRRRSIGRKVSWFSIIPSIGHGHFRPNQYNFPIDDQDSTIVSYTVVQEGHTKVTKEIVIGSSQGH